jgi:hypothetical protein
VAVHCVIINEYNIYIYIYLKGGGKGRAGTLLSSFLIKHGLKGPSDNSGY